MIEYKATTESEDLWRLLIVGKLAKVVYKIEWEKLLIVTFNITPKAKALAEDHGIEVLLGDHSNPSLIMPPL